MCDPISLGVGLTVAAVGVGLAGSAYSAYSQVQTGKEQAQQYKRQADLQQEQANYNIDQVTNSFDRTAGAQHAVAAATGFSSSSFSDVFADSAMEAALQKKAIRFSANTQSRNLLDQGNNAAENASNSAIGTVIGGFGNALSVGAKIPTMAAKTPSSSPWQTTVTYGSGPAPNFIG